MGYPVTISKMNRSSAWYGADNLLLVCMGECPVWRMQIANGYFGNEPVADRTRSNFIVEIVSVKRSFSLRAYFFSHSFFPLVSWLGVQLDSLYLSLHLLESPATQTHDFPAGN
jgi:hypothetical protein